MGRLMPDKTQLIRVDGIDDRGDTDNVLVWITDVDGKTQGVRLPKASVIELTEVDFMFDGPPGPESPRFIETHDAYTGRGVGWGQWIDNGDGTWSLIGLAAEVRRQVVTDA